MYMDVIVLGVAIVFVVIYSKRLQTYMFGFGAIDITFRILNIVCSFIPSKSVRTMINTYVPESVPAVINHYTKDMINMVLTFAYVLIMLLFLIYIFKVFIKRKKI